MSDRSAMIRPAAVLAALLAAPALASTVEDPDSPRFAEGLRVLGMRGEVKVERVMEVARLDPEPLYLAKSPDREAFFREGEDLCMAKGKLGHFVACDARLAQATARTISAPIRGDGITVWPRSSSGRSAIGGGSSWLPPILPPSFVPPPEPPVTPPVAPVPIPATRSLLFAALLSIALWPLSGPVARWFTADRGAAPGKNGWV